MVLDIIEISMLVSSMKELFSVTNYEYHVTVYWNFQRQGLFEISEKPCIVNISDYKHINAIKLNY